MKTLLDFALYYASRGWRVFPLRPADKIPFSNAALGIPEDAPGGCLIATTDQAQVKAWWERYPNANIGIATGRESNLVVVDVDVKSGGEESLLALKAEYGIEFTDTIQAMTGGGGRHLLYSYPAHAEIHNSAGKLAIGIDVRGDGGYIAAAPSMHPSGRAYQWDYDARPSITPLAQMPQWMVDKLHVNINHTTPSPIQGDIIEGSRNQALASFAGSMRRRGMTYDAILAALIVENDQKCIPPLSESEVVSIAKSVTRYEPSTPPRGKPIEEKPAPAPVEMREPMNAYQVGEVFINLLDNLQGRSIPTFVKPIDDATGGLERQNISILAARPGMGKTTLAWQIARCVSRMGLKVLVFSLEMSAASLWAKAVCGSLGVNWKDIRAAGGATPSLKAQLIARTSELMDAHHGMLLVDDNTHSTDTIRKQIALVKPDLVIVDHLRLVHHQSDNETHRLGAVTRIMKEIAKEENNHVMVAAQLSRDVEKRDNKRPTLSDLRDSGEIEENADLVLMMYRPDYYEDNHHYRTTKAEVIIRKARDGFSSGTINLDFHANNQWFSEPGQGAEY